MFTYLYKLEGRTPVRCDSTAEWANWFENADRRVKYSQITIDGEKVEIATIFLGIDYAILNADRKQILFETQIFGGAFNGRALRCSTWDEAEKQHDDALQLLFSVTA